MLSIYALFALDNIRGKNGHLDKKKEIKKQEQEGFPKILDVAEIYLDA